jgi:uncharacterized protein (DUF2249 family)
MTASDAITVDVRDDIRAGREPFGRIMAAVNAVQDGQHVILINIFEPVPLYAVMSERGFDHTTTRTADGDWQIDFYRA